jgi:DNA repair photolyase
MVEEKPDFLFIQTRSPLVTRDIDLFLQMKDRIRISITIETDLEPIRKVFSPIAPPIPARLKALEKLAKSNLPIQATVSPVLPFSKEFPYRLKQMVNRVCIDDFFMGDGAGGKRTKQLGIKRIFEKHNLTQWYDSSTYLKVVDEFTKAFAKESIFISKDGFMP